MAKKYLFYILLGGAIMFGGSVYAHAETDCDSQAKPALSCPEGYSIMCISAGGDHWGCGKFSSGIIIEVSERGTPVVETSGVKSTVQTQTRTVNVMSSETSSDKKNAVAKIEVRGWDPDKKQAIQAKVQAALENNKEITSVEITEDIVTVNYLAPAKLFGFLPVKFNLNISSDKNGMVKVKFPWFKFLIKTDFSNVAEEINVIFQNNQTDLGFLKLEDTLQRQVSLLQLISNIMKAKHDTVKNSINNIR